MIEILRFQTVSQLEFFEPGKKQAFKLDEPVKSSKDVIPAQAGIYKCPKRLDSAIKSRNDKQGKSTLYEAIKSKQHS